MIDRQVRRRSAHPQTQRVELGGLMATHAVGLDQAQHFHLLLFVLAADGPGGNRLGTTRILGEQDEMIANGRMRYVRCSAAVGRQLLEVSAPLFWHSVGIVQVKLVELFHVGSVATG